MSWVAVRDAVVVAIQSVSGYDPDRVLWAYETKNQPQVDYVSLAFTSSLNPGQDGITSSTDLTRPAGKEIKLQLVGFREAVLQIEVYTASVVDSVDTGRDALDVLEQIRSGLQFDNVREQLAAAAGVTPFDTMGQINYVPTIVSIGFRGKAVLDVRCFVPAEALAQYTGYIGSAGGTATIHGGNQDPETRPIQS